MPEFCSVEKDGHVTIVTIERPERMNALHPAANAELGVVFDEFAADDNAWVAIITGRGDRAFSAGNDLRHQAEGGKRVPTPSGFGGLTSRFNLSKPVIAAVNGVAMGGGFEIALACDLIIASDTAVFALPEPRVGLAALAGGLQRLPRQIGTKQALGMILTGRRVAAAEGQTLGFVNEVVPHGKVARGCKALGGAHLRMRTAIDSREQGRRLSGPRHRIAGRRHGATVRLGARDGHERRFRRRAKGVCREAPAELARTLTLAENELVGAGGYPRRIHRFGDDRHREAHIVERAVITAAGHFRNDFDAGYRDVQRVRRLIELARIAAQNVFHRGVHLLL